MKRFIPLVCSLLLSCTKPVTAPPPSVDAGARLDTPDAGASAAQEVDAGAPSTPPDAGASPVQADAEPPAADTAHCSASGLSPEPKPAQPPLPATVDSMRRRIIAAAVACDYEGLAALTREKGKGFTASFGDVEDVAGYWRELETKNGEPVLARMVKLLNLPYARTGDLYVWPSVHGENAKPEDWKAVEQVYTPAELAAMRQNMDGYIGLRLGIQPNGHWQFAVAGD